MKQKIELGESADVSLAALLQQHKTAAAAELLRLIQSASSDSVRLAALQIYFDRGFGTPPKSLGIATNRVAERPEDQAEPRTYAEALKIYDRIIHQKCVPPERPLE
jgi:hypothetical protein